jgi:hypothetical protein
MTRRQGCCGRRGRARRGVASAEPAPRFLRKGAGNRRGSAPSSTGARRSRDRGAGEAKRPAAAARSSPIRGAPARPSMDRVGGGALTNLDKLHRMILDRS